MHVKTIILSLCLAVSHTWADQKLAPSAENLALISAYQQAVESVLQALKSYDGGITGLPELSYTLYSTRDLAKRITSHMEQNERYTDADSAAICNQTVATSATLVDLLNVGKAKLPLVRQTSYSAIADSIVSRFHREDTYTLKGIQARMTPNDQVEAQEGFTRIQDAYDALLRAST